MAAEDPVTLIRADQRVEADPTPGMVRERAFEAAGLWAGVVHTEAGATSGWHHHGDHETAIFVRQGRLRMDTVGATLEAEAGDFLHVPAYAVHREANPGDQPSELVVVRAGEGPVTVNVEGP